MLEHAAPLTAESPPGKKQAAPVKEAAGSGERITVTPFHPPRQSLTSTPTFNAARIKQALTDRILDVAYHLLPMGRQVGGEFQIGNIYGEPGKSLCIAISGAKAGTWSDFAENGMCGGPLDLWMQARNLPFQDAVREAAQWLGGDFTVAPLPPRMHLRATTGNRLAPVRKKPTLPAMDCGTEQDIEQLSALRRISAAGLRVAAKVGLLQFGDLKGHRAWIVTDDSRLNAQARRLDGRLWEHIGKKAWTLPGAWASHPIGLPLIALEAHPPDILLVEGGPDLLAAVALVCIPGCRWCPVGMLGASNRIPDYALPTFVDRRVRIYPHNDESGKGVDAAAAWTRQLREAGAAKVDAFGFQGFFKENGEPVTDLNDCAEIAGEFRTELEGILP